MLPSAMERIWLVPMVSFKILTRWAGDWMKPIRSDGQRSIDISSSSSSATAMGATSTAVAAMGVAGGGAFVFSTTVAGDGGVMGVVVGFFALVLLALVPAPLPVGGASGGMTSTEGEGCGFFSLPQWQWGLEMALFSPP